MFVSLLVIMAMLSEVRQWRCGSGLGVLLGEGFQGDWSTVNLGATSNGERSGVETMGKRCDYPKQTFEIKLHF